jgi:hypothetical protein
MYVSTNATLRRFSVAYPLLPSGGKRITYSGRVFEQLGIQYAMGVRHIVICGQSGFTIFFTLSHKRHDCRKIVNKHKMCILIFSENFV